MDFSQSTHYIFTSYPNLSLNLFAIFILRVIVTKCFRLIIKRSNTRQSQLRLLDIRSCKRKLEKFSIKYRAAKLHNKLRELNLLPGNVEKSTGDELKNIYNKLKDSYLINNQELVNYMFEG